MRKDHTPLWFAAYCPSFRQAKNDPSIRVEVPRYRVYPVDGSDRWIAETNSELSPEVQEKCAHLIARAMSDLFRI